MRSVTLDQAFESWGSYDLDDPSRSSPRSASCGAVHRGHAGRRARRLARRPLRRGHGRPQRPAALQGHARRDGERTRRSSPRACPDRRSPGTCSRSTRPTTPGCAGSSPPPSRRGASKRCARASRRSSTTCSTTSPRRTRQPRRSGRVLRLPAAVHRHLRAPRRPRARPAPLGRDVHPAARARPRRRRVRARPRRRPTRSSPCCAISSRPSRPPRRRSRQRADRRTRRRRAARHPASCCRRSSS